MMKAIVVLLFSLSLIFSQETALLQYEGILIEHQHENEKEPLVVVRQKSKCNDIYINPKTIYGGDIASSKVPSECTKTFVTTVGKISPMVLVEGVKTVGEIEVLEFLKKVMREPESYILVDSRRVDWYEHGTIPGAINISYDEMFYDEDFPEDWSRLLRLLNIKEKNKKLDFSHAKMLLTFCNASWCAQSPKAIKSLIKLGYPKEKILWYRGGLQAWILSGFNTITPK